MHLKVRLGLDQHSIYLQPLNDWIPVDMSDMIGAPRCCGFLFGRVHRGDHLDEDFSTQKIYTFPTAVRRLAHERVWCVIIQDHINHASCFQCIRLSISLRSKVNIGAWH